MYPIYTCTFSSLLIFQSLLYISDQVFNIFNSKTEADQIRLYSCLQKFLLIHLSVCMTCRMQDTASCICHMRHNSNQFQLIHHFHGSFSSTL